MIEKKLRNGQIVKAYPISNSQKMMFLMSLKYGSGYPVTTLVVDITGKAKWTRRL